ncbi:MAG: type II toxin-antitoxin system YhaV family toxin, partial [Cyanobacteria bacterium J06597_1]
SKRAYGSSTDAYRVFQKMLESENSPNNWRRFLNAAENETERIKAISKIKG